MKMVNETQKIFGDKSIAVSALRCECLCKADIPESINVKQLKPFTIEQVRAHGLIGVVVQDDPAHMSARCRCMPGVR